MKTTTYYLPVKVVEFIAQEAAKENRKPSNWIATLMLRMMEERGIGDGQD